MTIDSLVLTFKSVLILACTTDKVKLCLSPSAKQHRNPCSRPPHVYQDLSTRHDWPVKKAIVDLPIRLKGSSGNSLSPLGAKNKDIGAASQTLLTEVKLRLWRRILLYNPPAQTSLELGFITRSLLTNASRSPKNVSGGGYSRTNPFFVFPKKFL